MLLLIKKHLKNKLIRMKQIPMYGYAIGLILRNACNVYLVLGFCLYEIRFQ